MKKTEALRLLKSQLHQVDWLKKKRASKDFAKWHRDTEIVIERIFGTTTRHLEEFKKLPFVPSTVTVTTAESEHQKAHENGLAMASATLSSMIKEVSDFWNDQEGSVSHSVDAHTAITKICTRFHYVAKLLTARKRDRTPFTIQDEYDAQDLFHALLKIDFDDIRPEEWSPSYAGGSSRMDFLLKDEKTVIEIKMSRKGLGQKEIGEQLIVDIEKYKSHPDCKHLFCFVYDPDGVVTNPKALEKDLSRDHGIPSVKVFVRPN